MNLMASSYKGINRC